MSTERDTKFNSFSRLLLHDIKLLMRVWEEARQNNDFAYARVIEGQFQDVFAQRAYDLVYFVLDKAEYHSGSFDVGWGTPDEIHETISRLPDMTAQPVEPPEESTDTRS